MSNTPSDREWGTKSLTRIYKKDTPGESLRGEGFRAREGHGGSPTPRLDDTVRIVGQVEGQGKKGIVIQTNSDGQYLYVRLKNGKEHIYHASDLLVLDESTNQIQETIYYYHCAKCGKIWGPAYDAKVKDQCPRCGNTKGNKVRDEADDIDEAWERNPNCQQCKRPLSPQELIRGDRVCGRCVKANKGKVWGNDKDDDYQESVDEHIVKVKGGYRLVSKKSGKNLGTYPTMAGAKKREGEVEYFKHHESAQIPSFKTFLKEQDGVPVDPPSSDDQVTDMPAPGMSQWMKANKAKYLKQYGTERGPAMLQAAAWDLHHKQKSDA